MSASRTRFTRLVCATLILASTALYAQEVTPSPSYSSGRFPYTEALEQPFTLPPGGLAGGKAMWEYSQKFAMKDYADFKLLAMFSGSGVIMSTASKPILNWLRSSSSTSCSAA